MRLVQHLIDETRAPHVELCLLDVSQPLLVYGHQHAAATLASLPQVHVWGMQCDFAELPLYRQLLSGANSLSARRRVFCLLGGTLANLDSEPRFFAQALTACCPGDLLLVDLPLTQGATLDPAEIKKLDKQWCAGVTPAEAAWWSGPIWRHVKDVLQVDSHFNLQTQCPIAGSYTLEVMAAVQLRSGERRQFSMFRYRRYAPDQVVACLRGLGWDQIGAMPFGSAVQPSSLRLLCKRSEPISGG